MKNKDYILARIKYQNFYILYNGIDEKTGKLLKDIVYEIRKEKENNNEYAILIHNELVCVCYDLLKKQLKLVFNYIYNDNEDDLNLIYTKLPKNVIAFIEKNAHGMENSISLKDIVQKDKLGNTKLYQIMGYNDSLKEILEMFFETDKYEESRKKFLQRDEGKLEAELLFQVKKRKRESKYL